MLILPLRSGLRNEVTTQIGDTEYLFTTVWNSRLGKYNLSVAVGGTTIVHGVQLVKGVDIFKSYPQVPLRNVYCINRRSIDAVAEFEDLGNDFIVVMFEQSDLEVEV